MTTRKRKSHLGPGVAPLIIVVIIAAAALLLGGLYYVQQNKTGTPTPKPGGGAICTMEAKQCPDGSYVGRTGPNCEFSACPGSRVKGDCSGPGDSCPSGYKCIEKCGPPVVRENDPPPGYYCELNEIANKPRMCPICLASNTLIDTPSGQVNVKDVKVGMQVWSADRDGTKIVSIVQKISSTPVLATHQMVHLVLSDKREVWVSPGHPIIDGRAVSELHGGDGYDGVKVISTELVPYWDVKTYDLLPDSETGEYWANGILLGSTLK